MAEAQAFVRLEKRTSYLLMRLKAEKQAEKAGLKADALLDRAAEAALAAIDDDGLGDDGEGAEAGAVEEEDGDVEDEDHENDDDDEDEVSVELAAEVRGHLEEVSQGANAPRQPQDASTSSSSPSPGGLRARLLGITKQLTQNQAYHTELAEIHERARREFGIERVDFAALTVTGASKASLVEAFALLKMTQRTAQEFRISACPQCKQNLLPVTSVVLHHCASRGMASEGVRCAGQGA